MSWISFILGVLVGAIGAGIYLLILLYKSEARYDAEMKAKQDPFRAMAEKAVLEGRSATITIHPIDSDLEDANTLGDLGGGEFDGEFDALFNDEYDEDVPDGKGP